MLEALKDEYPEQVAATAQAAANIAGDLYHDSSRRRGKGGTTGDIVGVGLDVGEEGADEVCGSASSDSEAYLACTCCLLACAKNHTPLDAQQADAGYTGQSPSLFDLQHPRSTLSSARPPFSLSVVSQVRVPVVRR